MSKFRVGDTVSGVTAPDGTVADLRAGRGDEPLVLLADDRGKVLGWWGESEFRDPEPSLPGEDGS